MPFMINKAALASMCQRVVTYVCEHVPENRPEGAGTLLIGSASGKRS